MGLEKLENIEKTNEATVACKPWLPRAHFKKSEDGSKRLKQGSRKPLGSEGKRTVASNQMGVLPSKMT